ncbi:MAG: TetR family transcriptional regulator [Elainellaceae cyanobacterium]
MSAQSTSTRQRLIQAALELFVSQGVSSTTTRQIANLAGVNEVTLFRNFGNKYGLFLAVIEESPTFTNLAEVLIQRINVSGDANQMLKEYARSCLKTLDRMPEFVRSVIGEADQYPPENRQAIGRGLTEANRRVAKFLADVIQQEHLAPHLDSETFASLLNAILLGYAIVEFTSDSHQLWSNRDEFLDQVTRLFSNGAFSPFSTVSQTDPLINSNSSPLKGESYHLLADLSDADSREQLNQNVLDLPATLVHTILRNARKSNPQDYALAYVLFGAGLLPGELAGLQRSHQICDAHQHVLQVTTPSGKRQVPVNQWILGKRYGSYTNNPLTKWLKSRKDDHSAMFIDENQPMSDATIRQHWHMWIEGLLTPEGQPPAIAQAHQTWCVEMLMRGMTLENLSILTGVDLEHLQPYARRAKEKVALEEAALLDRKPRSSGPSSS